MGNRELAEIQARRERARNQLAEQAAAAAKRAKTAEDASATVWAALDRRAEASRRRDADRARATATFDAAVARAAERYGLARDAAYAKADATYRADLATAEAATVSAVLDLLADARSTSEVAGLTGLTTSEVRSIKQNAKAADAEHAQADVQRES